MKKLLLIVALAVISTAQLMADNYLNVTNIPNGTAGESLTVSIKYTSDVDRSLIYSIYSSTSDGTSVDWGTQWAWVNNEVSITAGTDVETDISINLPQRLNSNDLDDGINYLFVLEFGDYSVGSYNGNVMTIAETTNPYTWAELTADPPSTIEQGETITLNYRYRAETDSKYCLKVALSIYNGYTYVADKIGHWVENFDGQPATGYINEQFDLQVPGDFPLSTDLASGERYVIEVGVSGENWAWIGISTKYDVTISAATNIKSKDAKGINLYPNPVKDMLTIDGVAPGKTLMIYSVTGALVKSEILSDSKSQTDVSDLAKGIYFIKTDNRTIKFIKN
ncbi:T9SS type A sorting domain-containing protein [Carboxylicivirga caseinilyticus]|uniref:T9SS type A sorting domain-containing protein n=1 Tax=Carboxylicivirga caseinilyticus TaxID=3417572 RepID=UPI003D336258|nr:T9SS type A sorting domain-containing protein [Marinilabiliaceae bacterium A049]